MISIPGFLIRFRLQYPGKLQQQWMDLSGQESVALEQGPVEARKYLFINVRVRMTCGWKMNRASEALKDKKKFLRGERGYFKNTTVS